jgi:hypothetical protein
MTMSGGPASELRTVQAGWDLLGGARNRYNVTKAEQKLSVGGGRRARQRERRRRKEEARCRQQDGGARRQCGPRRELLRSLAAQIHLKPRSSIHLDKRAQAHSKRITGMPSCSNLPGPRTAPLAQLVWPAMRLVGVNRRGARSTLCVASRG